MDITLKFNADQEYSITELWNAQRRGEVNDRGETVNRRIYTSVQEFIADIVSKTVVQTALRDFPPPSIEADIAQKKAIEERIMQASKSALVMSAVETGKA